MKFKQKENYDNRHKTFKQDILEPGDEVWISEQGVSREMENEQGSSHIKFKYQQQLSEEIDMT